jgi:two-component system LytT family response regulator
MIKTILIDDEPLARSIVREYLTSFDDIQIIAECNDGFEGIKAIHQHQPELIFLDVQMPKINGFEMLEIAEPLPDVIFTTAFDEYAMKAFEANAIDYLLKPFSKERFDKAIQKWLINRKVISSQRNSEKFLEKINYQADELNRIVVKNGANIKIIPVSEVLYLEAFDDYVKIYTTEGMQLKKKTLSHYEQTLDTNKFLRVHRSYIIQLQQLTKVEPYDGNNHIALLKTGQKIPVSRNGYLKLKEVLGI